MKYVLDTNVAFKWAVPEIGADKAKKLREDFHNRVHEFIAPDIFPAEMAHAFTKAERQTRIHPGESMLFWLDVMTDCPGLVPHIPLAQRALQIATSVRIGFYDCLYVALAEREACELVTADDRLVKNLQAKYPFIRELAAMR